MGYLPNTNSSDYWISKVQQEHKMRTLKSKPIMENYLVICDFHICCISLQMLSPYYLHKSNLSNDQNMNYPDVVLTVEMLMLNPIQYSPSRMPKCMVHILMFRTCYS